MTRGLRRTNTNRRVRRRLRQPSCPRSGHALTQLAAKEAGVTQATAMEARTFWQQQRAIARQAGRRIIDPALQLFFVLQRWGM